jgi:hypothetical protein
MNVPIAERLAKLRSEQQAGEQLLLALERKQQECRETLLRIAGAIQVLEEFQEPEATDGHDEPEAAVGSAA